MQVDDIELLMRRSSSGKILLRHFGGLLEDCVRITVGTRAENDRLLQTLTSMQEG